MASPYEGYLGVGVVQILFGTLVPGSIPVNAVIALCIKLPPDCRCERSLFACSPLAIHVAHWQVHLHKHRDQVSMVVLAFAVCISIAQTFPPNPQMAQSEATAKELLARC